MRTARTIARSRVTSGHAGVRVRQALRIGARALLALLTVSTAALAFSPAGRAATRATFLLPSLVTGEESRMEDTLGEPFAHTSTVIDSADGPVYLDIFAPTSPNPLIPHLREGLVVIPGVGDNRAVPQVLNLMHSLARAGVVAVEMTTNTLISYDMKPATVDAIVQATLFTQHIPSVGRDRVGLVGFSAGGSLACDAAADPRIAGALPFVTSFGGYYDARSLLTDIGRRALTADGVTTPWAVTGVPIQTLANIIGDQLPGNDALTLENGFNPEGIYLTSDSVAKLSPAGQAAYHLLVGDQPDRVSTNVAALPPTLDQLLVTLSPSAVVTGIRAPVYLLHDRNDQYVPYTESRAFDAALTRLGRSHQYAEFSIFQHVEVRSGLGLGQLAHDGGTLFQILIQVMLPGS